jgi:polyisoprenyl-phosphate glycosyltransferase
MTIQPQLISIVAPFYNESDGIEYFYSSITIVLDQLEDYTAEVICVDDGSKDSTLKQLIDIANRDSRFKVVELSRNFGKEPALTAGIDASTGNAVIPIDADLQDPPSLIPVLLANWSAGAEVVLARRVDRTSDTFIKRKTAQLFYKIHNKVSDIKIPENVGDFRLMDRKVVEALKRLPEQQRFMKGLFAWVGFRTTIVDYKREARILGNTKFSGWKLWNLALEGFTSFSTAPLKIWTYIGGVGSIITFSYAVFIVLRTLFGGVDIPGYASLLVAILFFGSLQLIGIGVLGEYIGRIYMETKHRPSYIIRAVHGAKNES